MRLVAFTFLRARSLLIVIYITIFAISTDSSPSLAQAPPNGVWSENCNASLQLDLSRIGPIVATPNRYYSLLRYHDVFVYENGSPVNGASVYLVIPSSFAAGGNNPWGGWCLQPTAGQAYHYLATTNSNGRARFDWLASWAARLGGGCFPVTPAGTIPIDCKPQTVTRDYAPFVYVKKDKGGGQIACAYKYVALTSPDIADNSGMTFCCSTPYWNPTVIKVTLADVIEWTGPLSLGPTYTGYDASCYDFNNSGSADAVEAVLVTVPFAEGHACQ
jgi:hypothetical protein